MQESEPRLLRNLHSLVYEKNNNHWIVKSFKQSFSSNDDSLRTEKDLPLTNVIFICGVIVVCTFIFYWTSTNSFLLVLVGTFPRHGRIFLCTVAGYIAGVVGSSNRSIRNDNCNIAIHSHWFGLLDLTDLSTQELMLATLLIASVVATLPR